MFLPYIYKAFLFYRHSLNSFRYTFSVSIDINNRVKLPIGIW